MPARVGVDGTLVDIPDLEVPTPGTPSRSRQACRVRLQFDWVAYGGDNIGPLWTIMITAGSGFWVSGSVELTYQARNPFGVEITNERLEGMCGLPATLPLAIKARERSFPWWPFKVGEIARLLMAPCLTTSHVHTEFITVPVSRRWPPKSLVAFRQTAILIFAFTLQSRCE